MKLSKTLIGLIAVLLLVACGDPTATSQPAVTTAPAAATTAPAAATTGSASATTAPAGTTSGTTATTAPAGTTSGTTATTAPAGTTSGTTATTAPAGTPSAVATTAPAAVTNAPGVAGTVTVASKNFTESIVTAEIYAAALENGGLKVNRKVNLGASAITIPALQKGDIDLYPEYTGTLIGSILKQTATAKDPKSVYDQAAKGLKEQYNAALLDVAPMNDSNGIVVTKATADKYKLKTLSDLAPVAKDLTFATIPDFVGPRSDSDGLGSLQKTYGGFQFKQPYITIADLNAKYSALTSGKADAGVAFTTDGILSSKSPDGQKLVLLQDDKFNFLPYQFAPVVRQSVLDANPKIKDILNAVSAKLTTEVVQELNYRVDVGKEEAVDVAKDFLKTQGLIK